MALADVLQGRSRCAWIHRSHPPQPRFNLGGGWEPGMRSLTNAPIVVAGLVVGEPLADERPDRASRRHGFARMAIAASRFPLLEGESSLEGLFAFRPTKEDTQASPVSPTSPAKAADRLAGGSRVSGRCPAPGCVGVCAWACGLARLASPDSAVAAALCSKAAVPLATYSCEEFGSS